MSVAVVVDNVANVLRLINVLLFSFSYRRFSSSQRRRQQRVKVSVSIESSAKKAFFFPGQGAQNVGMAKELCETSPEAKKMFDTAKDILGYDLLDVCVNGPAERLNSTEVSQPAIYVSSMAALEKMKSTAEGQADIERRGRVRGIEFRRIHGVGVRRGVFF